MSGEDAQYSSGAGVDSWSGNGDLAPSLPVMTGQEDQTAVSPRRAVGVYRETVNRVYSSLVHVRSTKDDLGLSCRTVGNGAANSNGAPSEINLDFGAHSQFAPTASQRRLPRRFGSADFATQETARLSPTDSLQSETGNERMAWISDAGSFNMHSRTPRTHRGIEAIQTMSARIGRLEVSQSRMEQTLTNLLAAVRRMEHRADCAAAAGGGGGPGGANKDPAASGLGPAPGGVLLRRLNRGYLLQCFERDLKDIDDQQVVKSDLLRAVFGITPGIPKFAIQRSRVIHPSSPFYSGLLVSTGLLLVYSAMTVPVALSFWNYDDPCRMIPTLYFDVFVDCFFITEVFCNFFIGYYDQGNYVDSIAKIARQYLSSPWLFWFDLSTSIPLSWVDLIIRQECLSSQSINQDASSNNARVLRLVKPFRVLKLLRVLRIFKFTNQVEDWVSYISGGTVVFKILRLFVYAGVTVHICACLYWRVKVEAATPEELDDFLAAKQLNMDDVGQIYTLCCYFIMTVFCTVGFGDIYPMNTPERVCIIVIFVAGLCVFGTLVSQTNSILLDLARESQALSDHMQGYTAFMRTFRIPRELELRVRDWVRYQFLEERAEIKKKAVLGDEKLPEKFRLALGTAVQDNLFSKIPFLSEVPEDIKAGFAAEITLVAKTEFYAAGSLVADHRVKADRMLVVASGSLDVFLPAQFAALISDTEKRKERVRLRVIRRGDCLGDCALVGDDRWAGSFGVEADVVARDNCSIVVIMVEDIQRIMCQIEYGLIKRRVEMGIDAWLQFQDDSAEEESRGEFTEIHVKMAKERPRVLFNWIVLTRRKLMDHASQIMAARQGEELRRKKRRRRRGWRSGCVCM